MDTKYSYTNKKMKDERLFRHLISRYDEEYSFDSIYPFSYFSPRYGQVEISFIEEPDRIMYDNSIIVFIRKIKSDRETIYFFLNREYGFLFFNRITRLDDRVKSEETLIRRNNRKDEHFEFFLDLDNYSLNYSEKKYDQWLNYLI